MTDPSETFAQDQNEALMEHILQFSVRAYAGLQVLQQLPELKERVAELQNLLDTAPDFIAQQGALLSFQANLYAQIVLAQEGHEHGPECYEDYKEGE